MAATVSFPCANCRAPLERPLPASEGGGPCSKCQQPITLHADALEEGKAIGCPACGERLLYRQKDFRQAVGCAVVLVAAALAPFTYYVSLGVAALVDWLLYRIAGEVVICYRVTCRAHVRGVPPGPKVGPFDLSIHDYYRMLARREAEGQSGPDDATGPPLDSATHH